jgi:acetyl esterase/lipase
MKTENRMKKILPLLLALLSSAALAADETPAEIHLWPNGAPGFESRANEKEVVTMHEEPGAAPFPVTSNIQNPSITPFLPPAGTIPTAAVIVAPGGGHRFLPMGFEGDDLGKWLSEHGVAAFVLKYRLARETNSVYRIDVEALQDAQRAIRLVRSRAKEWNINTNAVGMLGFSAGGEVTYLAAMHYDDVLTNAADAVDLISSRPDFQALIYPGTSSKITVNSNSPPAFLACASDDRPDISQGLPEVYLKFKAAHVPVELHIYTKGGHGFGIRDRPLAVSSWQFRFYDWLADMGFVKNPASK